MIMDKITSIDKMLSTLSSSSFTSGSRGGSSSPGTATTDTAVGSTSQGTQAPVVQQRQAVPATQPTAAEQAKSDEATATTTAAKKQALNEALSALQSNNTSLDFSIDQASGVLVVKVVDKATGDVVRQIPAEEVLVMRQQAEKTRGVLFNKVM
jgi:flagellar protein FlaG